MLFHVRGTFFFHIKLGLGRNAAACTTPKQILMFVEKKQHMKSVMLYLDSCFFVHFYIFSKLIEGVSFEERFIRFAFATDLHIWFYGQIY